MNVLVVCAHPDDVEVFCAGTLLKYRRQGHRIFLALTTSGNTGSNRIPSRLETERTREAEQLCAAAPLDARVRFLRFDDEGLQDTPRTRRAVLTAIRWADPDVVFTNAPADGSTDHRLTSALVRHVIAQADQPGAEADLPPISKKPKLFFFTSAVSVDFAPRAYVDISDVAEEKRRMLLEHKSQYAWMQEFGESDFSESMMHNCRAMGIQAGCRWAEGFCAFADPDHFGDYRLLP